ncbi:MAG: T9SS type A sorting domain-containing protein [Bacteroidia bacterium]
MKKIYFSLLSVLSVMGMNAQLTQANNAPANGDMYSTFQCDSTNITPGPGGASAVWNYSTIATHSSIVASYTASTGSSTTYPSANVAVTANNTNVSYYQSSAANLKYWGGNLTIGGIPATITYTSAAVNAVYPMNLNSAGGSVTGGTLNAIGNNGTFTGNSTTLLDGTGTLKLPTGTYTNTMRVVTSQTINFTAGFATGVVTQVNYDYYVPGIKAPMFTISTSSLTSNIGAPSQQTVVTRSTLAPVGLKNNTADFSEVSVYPNPSSSTINFVSANVNAANVTVYDFTGRTVLTSAVANGSFTLDVTNYAAGTYFYKITGSDKQVLKTGKIAVTH